MVDETRAIIKSETAVKCHLGAHAENPDVIFWVDNRVSIHRLEEVAEVTSHDFRLRNGKKDRLVSMEGELEATNPTTIRRRTGRSEVSKDERAMALDERRVVGENEIAGIRQ